MSMKSASAKTGKGLLSTVNFLIIAAHDGPRKERIEAIDKTVELLNEERARLVEELMDSTDV